MTGGRGEDESSGRTIVKTIKSTAVILILMGVLYGVYVALSPPPSSNSQQQQAELEVLHPPMVEFAGGPASEPPKMAGPDSPQLFPPFSPPVDAHPAPQAAIAEAGSPAGADTASPAFAGPTVEPPPQQPAESAENALASAADSPFRRSNFETPAATQPPPPTAQMGAPTADATAANPLRSAELQAFDFRRTWQSVERNVQAGKFRTALAELSPYYNHPEITAEERKQVLDWLDALAGKVIYGPEHLLEEPYRVQGRESLYEVADRYRIPAQLLRNINSGAAPESGVLLPGTELKVIPGPFRAEINVTAGELTLYLGDLYAGRFPFTVGDEAPQPGSYKVADKRTDKDYYGKNGQVIPALDPNNPFGGVWIDLGREISLHGSPARENGSQTLGCISFSPRDAQDVYGILSLNSEVRIVR